MSKIKHQKGFIQLGIIGLIVLTAGLFAVTKLATNPNLTFFNIAEKAAGVKCDEYGENDCGSKCSPAGYTCQWKKSECKTSSKKCNSLSISKKESGNTCYFDFECKNGFCLKPNGGYNYGSYLVQGVCN